MSRRTRTIVLGGILSGCVGCAALYAAGVRSTNVFVIGFLAYAPLPLIYVPGSESEESAGAKNDTESK